MMAVKKSTKTYKRKKKRYGQKYGQIAGVPQDAAQLKRLINKHGCIVGLCNANLQIAVFSQKQNTATPLACLIRPGYNENCQAIHFEANIEFGTVNLEIFQPWYFQAFQQLRLNLHALPTS